MPARGCRHSIASAAELIGPPTERRNSQTFEADGRKAIAAFLARDNFGAPAAGLVFRRSFVRAGLVLPWHRAVIAPRCRAVAPAGKARVLADKALVLADKALALARKRGCSSKRQ